MKFLLLTHLPGYALGWNVTQRGAGANYSVDVNVSGGYAGGLFATSANVPYFGWMDATKNVVPTASDPSNPRKDMVVAYVDLSVISTSITNNVGALKFKTVTGTPAPSPSEPNAAAIQSSVGAGNPYLVLALLDVATGATSILNASLTDRRTQMALRVPYLADAAGNIHRVPTFAADTVMLLAAAQTMSGKTIDNTNILGSGLITLGYAQITADATTSGGTASAVAGLSAAVTIPAGSRKVRISVFAPNVRNSTSSTAVGLSIWDGTVGSGTQLQEITPTSAAANANVPGICQVVVTPAAGAKTYNAGFRNIGGATATLTASATAPAYILVEAL